MQRQARLAINALAISAIISACATFNAQTHVGDLLKTHQPTVKESREDLWISIEEFVSQDKSRKAFDADLALYGVLALFVRLENTGRLNYLVDQNDAKAYLGDQLLPKLEGVDAARKTATSDSVGKAAAWTLATGPFAILLWAATISGSAAHTSQVNHRIESHFQNFELGKVNVRPNQIVGGFVYFEIPREATKLEKLKLQLPAVDDGKAAPVNFTLIFPTLELSR